MTDIIKKKDFQEFIPNFIIKIFEDLIDIKGISVKKLYRINKEIIEYDLLNIKNIYCKYRNNKNKMCLNKCVNNTKYCSIHDPIKREEKREKRIELNKFRKESKILGNIEYEIGEYFTEYIPSEPLPEYDIYPIPYAPNYEEIENKNEVNGILGNIVKEMLKDKFRNSPKINNEKIVEISRFIENIKIHDWEHYKEKYIEINGEDDLNNEDIFIFIKVHNEKLIKKIKSISDDIVPLIDKVLITNNSRNISNIEEYKEELNKLDFQYLCENYKGINIQRLYKSTLEYQFKLLSMKNINNNINNKLINFINNIVKKVPK